MEPDRINLLMVDDEEQFLSSMKKRLEVRGFNVLTVSRGQQALEAARRFPVDIALVDLKMPGMDGQATLEALKREHEWMEVIILTGYGTIDSAVQATKTGAYFYLEKPCEFDRLLEVLAEAYKKRIINKTQLKEQRIAEILAAAKAESPLDILRKLKELDARER